MVNQTEPPLSLFQSKTAAGKLAQKCVEGLEQALLHLSLSCPMSFLPSLLVHASLLVRAPWLTKTKLCFQLLAIIYFPLQTFNQ